MNRKQRRSQMPTGKKASHTKRRSGLTFITVAGLAGTSLGLTAPANALQPVDLKSTNCTQANTDLANLASLGGIVRLNFEGVCPLLANYVLSAESTIIGPGSDLLTLQVDYSSDYAFASNGILSISNIGFKTGGTPNSVITPFTFVSVGYGSSTTVTNVKFADSQLDTSAIYVEGHLKVNDSSFLNLKSGNLGAAIYGTPAYSDPGNNVDNPASIIDISGSTFTGNEGSSAGGAIFSEGSLTVTDSTFDSNTTLGEGGAISGNSSMKVAGTTFIGNTAVNYGGAIKNYGTTDIDNSTFVDNNVLGTVDGSALSLSEGSIISNNTFLNNGNLDSESIETDFSFFFGNILANETPGVEVIAEGYVGNFDLGANLYTDSSFIDTTSGDGSSRQVTNDELKLRNPGLNTTGLINSGKTKTIAIEKGSVARDFYSATSAGINPTALNLPGWNPIDTRLATLDQRGVARPIGTGYDVGAFEYGEDPVVVPVETPAVVTKATIAAQKIKFAPGSSKLSKASKKKLRTLAAEIQAKGLKTVNLEGYTATLTKAAPSGKVLRVKLSKARATAVEKYLKQQFKKSGYSVTFTKTPKGAANRVKSNQTEKGRADNRRVEITIN